MYFKSHTVIAVITWAIPQENRPLWDHHQWQYNRCAPPLEMSLPGIYYRWYHQDHTIGFVTGITIVALSFGFAIKDSIVWILTLNNSFHWYHHYVYHHLDLKNVDDFEWDIHRKINLLDLKLEMVSRRSHMMQLSLGSLRDMCNHPGLIATQCYPVCFPSKGTDACNSSLGIWVSHH